MSSRYEVKIELRDGFPIEKGIGNTIKEARDDLIRRIRKNDLIFPPEKEGLIKQILDMGAELLKE